MTIDEAIKHCLDVAEQKEIESLTDRWNDGDEWSESIKEDCKQCAADHRQLAEWLMEYKDLKSEQNEQYVFIRELMDELKEAKRLLRLAADDIETAMAEEKCKVCGLDYCGNDTICKWRFADEVEKFLKQ